jgi:hypothetical protein
MKYRTSTEGAIQRALFTHLRMRAAAGVVAFHVPNGGYRRPIEAAIMKGQGVLSGVPDVIAVKNGCTMRWNLSRRAVGSPKHKAPRMQRYATRVPW